MKIFDSLLISTLSYLPKWFAKPFSTPYVAGETEDEVIIPVNIAIFTKELIKNRLTVIFQLNLLT